MGSVIKARTISSVVDNRIRLTNSNSARLWSSDIGTTWTTIRVGCRISIEDSGANITSTPRFAFGICSGTSNIFMDATTTHWFGLLSTDPGWGRDTSSGTAVYQMALATIQPQLSKRIGGTITSGGTLGALSPRLADCTVAARSVMFLDFTKGSPNFSVKLLARDSFTNNDVSLSTYLAQLTLLTPSITNHTYTGATTLAIDEATNGYFNAVNFAWDRSSPAIEISDIAVVKLA